MEGTTAEAAMLRSDYVQKFSYFKILTVTEVTLVCNICHGIVNIAYGTAPMANAAAEISCDRGELFQAHSRLDFFFLFRILKNCEHTQKKIKL